MDILKRDNDENDDFSLDDFFSKPKQKKVQKPQSSSVSESINASTFDHHQIQWLPLVTSFNWPSFTQIGSIIIAGCCAYCGYLFVKKFLELRSGGYIQVGVIHSISCYPVMHCEGLKIHRARCNLQGLANYQGLLDGGILAGRMERRHDPNKTSRYRDIKLFGGPELSQFITSSKGDSCTLSLKDSSASITLSPREVMKKKGVEHFRVSIYGRDLMLRYLGDEAANWIRRRTNLDNLAFFALDLEEMAYAYKRQLPGIITLHTQETVSYMNGLFKVRPPVSVYDFHPNIVIVNSKPLQESKWQIVKIGSVQLNALSSDVRIIEDPYNTYAKTYTHDADPHVEHKDFVTVPGPSETIVMGLKLLTQEDGEIHVGDRVFATFAPEQNLARRIYLAAHYSFSTVVSGVTHSMVDMYWTLRLLYGVVTFNPDYLSESSSSSASLSDSSSMEIMAQKPEVEKTTSVFPFL